MVCYVACVCGLTYHSVILLFVKTLLRDHGIIVGKVQTANAQNPLKSWPHCYYIVLYYSCAWDIDLVSSVFSRNVGLSF